MFRLAQGAEKYWRTLNGVNREFKDQVQPVPAGGVDNLGTWVMGTPE